MPKSNRIVWSSGRGRLGNVHMIDVTHRISALRRAKIAFWVLLISIGTLTAVVLSATKPALLAAFIGLLVGTAIGGLIGGLIFIWPAVRVIWHWAIEISAFALVMVAYLAAVHVMAWWLALVALVLALAGPFGYPGLRRYLMSWIWCAISRHRLRTAFAAFIATNRHGTHPLILHARPTPAGERVRIWLRSGLSLADLEARRDKFAVVCWGKDVRVSPASKSRAALVDVDITRRNPLTKKVASPLPSLILGQDIPSDAPVSPAIVPTALDLPDVPEHEASEPAKTEVNNRRPKRTSADAPEPAAAAVGSADDIENWI